MWLAIAFRDFSSTASKEAAERWGEGRKGEIMVLKKVALEHWERSEEAFQGKAFLRRPFLERPPRERRGKEGRERKRQTNFPVSLSQIHSMK